MENLQGKLVYIQNIKYGYMFAADKDVKDGDHIVETRPCTKDDDKTHDKFKWEIIDALGGCCTIRNLKYDYMFAATNDKKDDDHIVEARPNSSSDIHMDKFRWVITKAPSGCDYYIKNEKYGYMFAADGDVEDGDHIVEARPDGSGNLNQDKFKWRIVTI